MIIVSHRGNITGPGTAPNGENSLRTIDAILGTDHYQIEIDVWGKDFHLFLGHDGPEGTVVPRELLESPGIWWHAKNLRAAEILHELHHPVWFSHYRDDFALTSNGLFWTLFDRPVGENSILVLPELAKEVPIEDAITLDIKGICTDFPFKYYEELQLWKQS
jgi:hypothetical protein